LPPSPGITGLHCPSFEIERPPPISQCKNRKNGKKQSIRGNLVPSWTKKSARGRLFVLLLLYGATLPATASNAVAAP